MNRGARRAELVVGDYDGSPGEVVTYTVTATDPEDYQPSLVCIPPSGSWFPRGTTLVACTATDFSGNQTNGEFTVTVGAKLPAHFPAPSPR